MLAHQHMMRMSSVIATALEDHLRNVSHFVHLRMEELGTSRDQYRFERCRVLCPMEAKMRALIEVLHWSPKLSMSAFLLVPR